MASPPSCPKCESEYIYRMSNKPVKGIWTPLSRIWNCTKCLHEWSESEEEAT